MRTRTEVKMTGIQEDVYHGLSVIRNNVKDGIYGCGYDFDMKDLVEDINSSLQYAGETPEEFEARLSRELEKEAEERRTFASGIKAKH